MTSENKFQFSALCFGEGNGTPLQYPCLENPMDRGAWKTAVHGVVEGWTPLSNFSFTFHFHALEKEMATHSSVLAWRIPGTGEPGGLPSMGSHRVGHEWSDLAAAAAGVQERVEEWLVYASKQRLGRASLVSQTVKNLPAMQETGVRPLGWDDPLEKGMAIPSSILAWRIPWTESLAGYSPWGCKGSDTTEQLTHSSTCAHRACSSFSTVAFLRIAKTVNNQNL